MNKSKKRKLYYKQDHTAAKLITWAIGLPLLWFLIEDHTVFMLAMVLHGLYYFGVNTIAHIIEIVRKHRRQHDWF